MLEVEEAVDYVNGRGELSCYESQWLEKTGRTGTGLHPLYDIREEIAVVRARPW